MNLLILDECSAQAGDTITLKIEEVIPADGGFVAKVSETGAEEAPEEPPAEEEAEPEAESEMPMSPMAKRVLKKK